MQNLAANRLQSRDEWMTAVDELLHSANPFAGTAALALNDLLEQALHGQHDEWIHEAAGTWPHHASAFRKLAETCSEHAELPHAEHAHLALFAVPLIFKFDEDIPTSQFDALVFPQGCGACLSSKLLAHHPLSSLVLSSRAYRFEELRSVRLSAVHRAAHTLAQGQRVMQTPSLPADLCHRRRRSFLRVLIGFCSGPDALRAATVISDVNAAAFISNHVRRTLGAQAETEVLFDGTYHESLYGGMWRYQECRVRELTCAALQALRPPHEAMLEWISGGIAPTLALSFAGGDARSEQRSYVLSTRPGDAPASSIDRMVNALASSGMTSIGSVVGNSAISRHPKSRRSAAGMVRVQLPI